jgi:hypothetical protein
MNSVTKLESVAGIVTIDVEPDNVWRNSHSRTFLNISRLPRFHQICTKYGIRPTYLVSWSVASDIASAKILELLLRGGECEIGMHPHLWETPPFVPIDKSSAGSVGPSYETGVLEEKISSLIELLSTRFGVPTSHRAGRWGLDIRQIPILIRHGIIVDTSVIPGVDWSSTGIEDYTNAQLSPYFMAKDNLIQSGASLLLQVPCTIRPGMRFNGMERNKYLAAVFRRFKLDATWLRVTPKMEIDRLLDVCSWAAVRRLPHLNLMSHSSEFMEDGSPYWKRKSDIENHFAAYHRIFEFWCKSGVIPMTLTEFAQRIIRKANEASAR